MAEDEELGSDEVEAWQADPITQKFGRALKKRLAQEGQALHAVAMASDDAAVRAAAERLLSTEQMLAAFQKGVV